MLGRKLAFAVVLGLAALEAVLQLGSVVAYVASAPEAAPAGDGRPRILCVGDSYTFGLGASATTHSYPSTLQRLLQEELGTVAPHVVNAGWPGENSRELLRKLAQQLHDHRPVLVLVLVGLNDTWSRPARLDESEVGERGGWQLRWRTWRLLQILFGGRGGPGEAAAVADAKPAQRALALVQAGRPEDAVVELEHALAADPAAAPECHQGLVLILTSLGQRERAAASLQWLADEHRQRPSAAVAEAYASALAAVGQRAESLAVAAAAAQRFPDHAALWWLAGSAHFDLGDLAAAEQALDRAVAAADAGPAEPQFRATVRRTLAAAVADRDLCKAIRALLESLQLEPDFARCRIVIGGAAEHFTAAAVQRCVDAMQLDAKQFELLRRLFAGEILDQAGQRRGNYAELGGVLEVLDDHLGRIVQLCRAAGAETILLSYPLRTPELEAVHRRIAVAAGLRHVAMLPRFEQELRQRAQSELYVADMHCTDRGYELMAREVLPAVLAALRR